MPTSKPRVMLTLEPSEYATLTRLATLQGRPLAAVLRDFVSECTPIFNQISDAIEAAKNLQQNAPRDLLERLEGVHAKAAPVLMDLLSSLQDVVDTERRTNPQ